MAEINENVHISEDSDNIEVIETVEIIEVSEPTSYTIDSAEAFPALGETNENLKHQLLNGRELADQHPIAAITGLRDELDDIESLQVIYSPDRNQANYYLWQDENILQENRVGYFVSACSDINEIEICTSDNEIFGVTVDNAGFIGAQSDVARDIKYGLVVNTGIVHVRCEQSVDVGDYVVSNDYGYAQKNDNGYRVVGRHQINGVEYAEIILATPINQICKLSDNVENIGERMDDAEKNIVSAINVANAAYNKASESIDISEEALKNAIDAVLKADDVIADVDQIEEVVSSTNEIAVQAKTIAESATVTAEAIRQEVVKTSNETLAEVNDLIEDLEPITTWSDPETGNTGAEYLTTYIKEGLATKVEVQTVETLTNDNKSAIEKSAEEFSSFISSVDKYSVGEYSQAYGLTYEQAKSILKEGMIYVPTKHENSQSHSETFEDTEEENWFTPGSYYVWTINDQGIYDWVETKDSVAFFSEELTPSNALRYWYIDSNEPPEGYEAHTLYINQDGQWTKVNILDGNVNNRITSMVQQRADKIAMDVADAQGDIASHQQWLDDNSANIQDVVSWKSDVENDVSNIATIKQTADAASASIAQVVEAVGKDGEVNAASIVLAITDGKSSTKITADYIVLNGYTSNANGSFQIDPNGYMKASGGGTIAGWHITDNYLYSRKTIKDTDGNDVTYTVGLQDGTNDMGDVLVVTKTKNGENSCPFILRNNGLLMAEDAHIAGGTIGGWTLEKGDTMSKLYANYNNCGVGMATKNTDLVGPAFWAGYKGTSNPWGDSSWRYNTPFYVTHEGYFKTAYGNIAGWEINSNILYYPTTWNVNDGTLSTWGTGMSATEIAGNPAFWAGFAGNGQNPYEHDAWKNEDGSIKDGSWKNYASFYVLNDGTLYASKATISGTLNAGSIISKDVKLGGSNSTIKITSNDDGYWGVYGTHTSISCTDNKILLETAGNQTMCRIKMEDGAGYLLGPTWWYNDQWINGSDYRIKNSITLLNDINKMDLFFDYLKPVRYKYNHGTSNRFHCGFIAQEVEDGLNKANLTTFDFAGVVIGNNPDTQEEQYGLRYTEFISLNTWQIQKAKARITELENKVAELEELIKGE